MRHGFRCLLFIFVLFAFNGGCESDSGTEDEPTESGPAEPIGEEREGVIRILSRRTGKAPDEISTFQTLEQVGVDDLALVGILSELEDRYGINLPDETVETASGTKDQERAASSRLTIGRLVELVKRARGAP